MNEFEQFFYQDGPVDEHVEVSFSVRQDEMEFFNADKSFFDRLDECGVLLFYHVDKNSSRIVFRHFPSIAKFYAFLTLYKVHFGIGMVRMFFCGV